MLFLSINHTFVQAVLPSGEEVAVKRGSSSPAYAEKLFKMESIVLSNLQHPNIIKLLGYCIKGETLWLLYEFMENRSLDYIIGWCLQNLQFTKKKMTE